MFLPGGDEDAATACSRQRGDTPQTTVVRGVVMRVVIASRGVTRRVVIATRSIGVATELLSGVAELLLRGGGDAAGLVGTWRHAS